MIEIKGCGTALVTPFKDGAIDYETYRALVKRQVFLGAHFLVPLGTTGETPTMTDEEKVQLLKITRQEALQLPLVVGCGSNAVHSTLANMKLLEPYGVDAWLVVVPFYNKPTQEGQYQYFKTIAESTSRPVIIYNVPGRTGVNMTAETCLRLAKDVENIIGIKEASGKIDQIEAILKDAPAGFSVLSGDDDITVSIMKKGAKGVISVASNLIPGIVAEMVEAGLVENWEKADELDAKLHRFFKDCFIESNPIPIKAAMEVLNLMRAEVRLPLSEATESTKIQMANDLKELLNCSGQANLA